MRIDSLVRVIGIRTASQGHKHYRHGWINMECPWCVGNPGFHLGFNLKEKYFYCWRCGWKPLIPTLKKLAPNYSLEEILEILDIPDPSNIKTIEPKRKTPSKSLKLPSGCGPLTERHKLYLKSRGLDPDEIEADWKVLGTGPVSTLDGLDYKYRILIPIFWEGQMVSFQTRDITEKSPFKYKACPIEYELTHHKDILYIHPEALAFNSIIVTEGVFDVWKMGKRSAAMFGISYKTSQITLLASLFDKIIILFDNDPMAQKQASKLASELRMAGKKAEVAHLPPEVKDPGSMEVSEARRFASNLLKII